MISTGRPGDGEHTLGPGDTHTLDVDDSTIYAECSVRCEGVAEPCMDKCVADHRQCPVGYLHDGSLSVADLVHNVDRGWDTVDCVNCKNCAHGCSAQKFVGSTVEYFSDAECKDKLEEHSFGLDGCETTTFSWGEGVAFAGCTAWGAGGCGGADKAECQRMHDFVMDAHNIGKDPVASLGTKGVECNIDVGWQSALGQCIRPTSNALDAFYRSMILTCDANAPEVYVPASTWECNVYQLADGKYLSPSNTDGGFEECGGDTAGDDCKWTIRRQDGQ